MFVAYYDSVNKNKWQQLISFVCKNIQVKKIKVMLCRTQQFWFKTIQVYVI
jgi:hypothetical protein